MKPDVVVGGFTCIFGFWQAQYITLDEARRRFDFARDVWRQQMEGPDA